MHSELLRKVVKIIKKLDIFILRNYLVLFAGTFCISLFVVMMQFLWRYVDDLVGKGLTLDVMAKFFFYAGETLVPLALPLGVLLASLISFGNLGEKLELLAIKAAGIPLIRTIRPLIVFNLIIAGVSFYFQNNVAPKATENLYRLLWSIREASPEVDIPEGVFYSGVEGLNMYVKKKNKETGVLYDLIIYNMRDGVNNAHIVLADSGRLETSASKEQMLLHLWNGEQFENIANSGLRTRNVPYRRETFVNKLFVIDFNTNFTMEDNEAIGRSADTKRMDEILGSVDSMKVYYDSMAVAFFNDMTVRSLYVANTSRARVMPYDSTKQIIYGQPVVMGGQSAAVSDTTKQSTPKVDTSKKKEDVKPYRHVRIPDIAPLQNGVVVNHKEHVNFDTVFAHLESSQKQSVIMGGLQRVNISKMDLDYKAAVTADGDAQIRRHWVQFWSKITMALACLIFFFIGAPLGAIIRKGGLGMPVVIAVLIFIIYYIINTGGMRAGREGSIPVWFGMWLSSLILMPVAAFLTIKSNNDSVVFNIDAYTSFFRKLIGKRQKRHIVRKEVIINDPDYAEMHDKMDELIGMAKQYRKQIRRPSLVKYIKYIFKHVFSRNVDEDAERLSMFLEHIVDVLSNSKDRKVLLYLNGLPVLDTHSFRFYRRRRGDVKNIIEYGELIKERIKDIIYEQSKIQ